MERAGWAEFVPKPYNTTLNTPRRYSDEQRRVKSRGTLCNVLKVRGMGRGGHWVG